MTRVTSHVCLLYCHHDFAANTSPVWETIVETSDSAIKRCDFLVKDRKRMQSWFNTLAFELSRPGLKKGWGRVDGDKRAAVFFSRYCNCKYQFDRRTIFEGQPFPDIILDILRQVMPLCGIKSHAFWPNVAHVNWYSDG